ncbi:hypothetical protein NIIDMKKI_68750 [Mycobacterium kansasii]|nr:hypothetical protein NIIDMKKI_68750 [Mycobacterium kansasii]
MQAIQRIGTVFEESNTDSVAMIVLEGAQPLGDEAHEYYDDLVRKLRDDTRHVQHVQDFWGIHLPLPVRKVPMTRPHMFS